MPKQKFTTMGDCETLVYFRRAGIIPTVMQILQMHSTESKIAKRVFTIIRLLAQDDTNRDEMISRGACEMMVDVIRMHFSQSDVLDAYIDAIISLGETDDGCSRIMSRQTNSLSHVENALIIQLIRSKTDDEYDENF
jgi:hypothetical protein